MRKSSEPQQNSAIDDRQSRGFGPEMSGSAVGDAPLRQLFEMPISVDFSDDFRH
jgi:hypothetical protein